MSDEVSNMNIANKSNSKERRTVNRRILKNKVSVTATYTQPNEDRTRTLNGFILDMTPQGIGLVLDGQIDAHQKVMLSFEANHFKVDIKVEARWNRPLPVSGKILKKDKAAKGYWRMGFLFVFASKEEEELVRNLAETL